MDRNEIIRMAREVGLLPDNSHPAPQTRHMTEKQACIERFAALVAKQSYLDGVNSGISAEREACAKVCMNLESRADIPDGAPEVWWEIGCVDCADAIRKRGNHANG